VAREEAALWVADEILRLLKDGKWHDLKAIAEKCSKPEPKVKITISFLSEYGFIEMNKKGRKARLCPLMLEFFDEIQHLEKEQAIKS
jgi:DNA-binding IclR family transcriptional regulator